MSVLFAFGFGRMQQGLDRRRQVLLSLDAENRDLAEHLFERLAQSMGELESLLAAPATDAAALGAPVEGIQLALGQARDTALRPLPSGADLAASDPVERVRLGFLRLGAWIAAGAVMLVPLLAWRGGFWSTQSSVNLAAGLLMLAYMALVGPLRRPQVTVWFLFSAEFTVLCQGVLTWDHGALSPNLMEAPVLVVLVGLAVGNLSAAVVAGLGALLAALDWGLGPRAMLRVNQDFDLGVGLFFALFAAGQLLDLHRQMGREMARVLEGLEGRINHRRRLMGFLFHDMMTPLSLLTMSLEGTELDLDPAARPRFLGEVRRLARKFAVARPFVLAASAVEAPRSVFKLAPLLEELKAASHGALLAKGLQLYLDCPAGLEVESVAEVLSGSVLAHLLNNAIQFTPPGGAVVLRAEALAGGLARLQVLDQGPGFKPQTLEALHAGGPAARIHQALGLALAQDYAQRLGGRLELVNQLNGGGEARLFLPLAGA